MSLVHTSLLRRIEFFIVREKMAISTFGELACRNPSLVQNLRKGRRSQPRTIARIEAFMKSHSKNAQPFEQMREAKRERLFNAISDLKDFLDQLSALVEKHQEQAERNGAAALVRSFAP